MPSISIKKYVTTSGTFKVPQKGDIRWQFIKMVTQENGAPYFALLIGGGTEADTKERFCDQAGSSELGAGNYAETGSKT